MYIYKPLIWKYMEYILGWRFFYIELWRKGKMYEKKGFVNK